MLKARPPSDYPARRRSRKRSSAASAARRKRRREFDRGRRQCKRAAARARSAARTENPITRRRGAPPGTGRSAGKTQEPAPARERPLLERARPSANRAGVASPRWPRVRRPASCPTIRRGLRMSDRRYSTAPWQRLRKAVLARDGHVCQFQGPNSTYAATTCDHILPTSTHPHQRGRL
jgi:5-methylcytosine-specific restriction endonuclease McrA